MTFWSRGAALLAPLAPCLLLVSCGNSSADADPVEPDAGSDSDIAIVPPGDGAVITDASLDRELSYLCEPVEPPTECPNPPPTFADVSPIIGQRCSGPCHSGTPNGPWPLATYQHVADWKDDIRSHLLDCSMPPQDGGVPITTAERVAILTWIRCGLPSSAFNCAPRRRRSSGG